MSNIRKRSQTALETDGYRNDDVKADPFTAARIGAKKTKLEIGKMMWFRINMAIALAKDVCTPQYDAQMKQMEYMCGTAYGRALVNERNADGRTALMIAAAYGAERLVRYLVGVGANEHLIHANGLSAMAIAASEGHTSIVQFFLNRGMSMKRATVHGDSINEIVDDARMIKIRSVIAYAAQTVLSASVSDVLRNTATWNRLVEFERLMAEGNSGSIPRHCWIAALMAAVHSDNAVQLALLHTHSDRPDLECHTQQKDGQVFYLDAILANVSYGKVLPKVAKYISCERQMISEKQSAIEHGEMLFARHTSASRRACASTAY